MKIKIFILCFITIGILVLSGCQEDISSTISIPDKVFLESDVVEFANVTFQKIKNREGVVVEAKLEWLLHNIAGRTIDIGIDILIFDADDIIIYSDSKLITEMPADWTEHYSPFNSIRLTGEEAKRADYVIIQAVEV